jgi:hypothetical protein
LTPLRRCWGHKPFAIFFRFPFSSCFSCTTSNRSGGKPALSSGVSTMFALLSITVLTSLFTTSYRLQVQGLTLSQCATVSIFLGTTQIVNQPPPAPPYWLIAYPVQGPPSVFLLNPTGTNASWTANLPLGEPAPTHRRFSTVANLTPPHGSHGRVRHC